MCSKISYPDKKSAINAMLGVREKKKPKGVAYYCRECAAFHFSSMKKGQHQMNLRHSH